jgi:hypothetical protein
MVQVCVEACLCISNSTSGRFATPGQFVFCLYRIARVQLEYGIGDYLPVVSVVSYAALEVKVNFVQVTEVLKFRFCVSLPYEPRSQLVSALQVGRQRVVTGYSHDAQAGLVQRANPVFGDGRTIDAFGCTCHDAVLLKVLGRVGA